MSDATPEAPAPEERVPVRIYKGAEHEGVYLYVPAHGDLAQVPHALLDTMGRLTQVMEVELHPERRLAREDARVVLGNLKEQGYHLQMPPPDTVPTG